MRMRMTTRPCLLVSSTLSGSRIHPHYVKRFRKICPEKSVGWLNELPQNRGREQLQIVLLAEIMEHYGVELIENRLVTRVSRKPIASARQGEFFES